MRSKEAIEYRIHALIMEELDRRVAEAHLRLPKSCVHNHRHPLDTRKKIEDEPNKDYNKIALPVVKQTMGLCMYGSENREEWPGNLCEDPIDAQRCSLFTPSQTKEDLWKQFSEEISNVEWLKDNFPEIWTLLWSLNMRMEGTLSITMPWWKRLWFWLLRIKVEPVQEFDPIALLPELVEAASEEEEDGPVSS